MIPILKYNLEGDLVVFDEIPKHALFKAEHSRKSENDEETFDGTVTDDYRTLIEDEFSYLLVPYDDEWREFVVTNTEQYDGEIDFNANATYFEFLKKSKPREPQEMKNISLQEAMEFCLQGTRFEPGIIEYAGNHTIKWVDYNSPYDILKIICTAFDVQFDARIETDTNSITGRYIDVRKKGALFDGKEIVRGKDLISLKRSVDKNEIVTALLAVGPEPEEQEGEVPKERVTTVVWDNNANARWGEPDGRYRWDVYSPESENSDMTVTQLKRYARTELRKRIDAAITYEIESYDLQYHYPHERVRFGDLVRIKDLDFKPPLYAESEVIELTRDLIDPSNSKFTVGNVKEFKESDLLKQFGALWLKVKEKLDNNVTNINTIVNQVVKGELEHVEKKVYKSPTPPENPVNDMYWFDTSNPRVGVLKRYFNGEWIVVTDEEKDDMQGLTREIALYRSLVTTYENLAIQHLRLYQEVTALINNQYLVDEEIKTRLNASLNGLVGVYEAINTRLQSINEDTATIGYLIDTQELFQKYRSQMQELYNVVETAKLSIDERFKLLQSQYTDKKFDEALNNIANKFGLTVNEDGFLIGEPNTVKQAVEAARIDTQEQLKSYVKSVDYETDKDGIIKDLNATQSSIEQLPNSIEQSVSEHILESIPTMQENILFNTEYLHDPDSWRANIEIVQGEPNYANVTASSTGSFGVLTDKETTIESNKLYKIEFDYKTTDVSEFDYLYFMTPTGQTNIGVTYTVIGDRTTNPDGAWHTMKLDYNSVADIENVGFLVATKSGMNFSIRNLRMYEYVEETKDGYERLKNLATVVNQQSKSIKLKASSEDFNKVQKIVNKTSSEVLVDVVEGITLSHDENGNVSDVSINDQGIQLNSDLININDGDVRIQNGVTTITNLVADKIKGGTLSSIDGGLQFNLNSNDLNLYKSSVIRFNSGLNQIVQSSYTGSTSGGVTFQEMGNPEGMLAIFGSSVGNQLDPTDDSFSGLVASTGNNSVSLNGNQIQFRGGNIKTPSNAGWIMDTVSRGEGTNRYFHGIDTASFNYILGRVDAPFRTIYTQNIGDSQNVIKESYNWRVHADFFNRLWYKDTDVGPVLGFGDLGILFGSYKAGMKVLDKNSGKVIGNIYSG